MQQNELMHYGVKGMKWGVRRHQNKNGSLTPAGKKREKSSFNTSYTPTSLDTRGRLLTVNGKVVTKPPSGVTRSQNNKAKRAALREGYAYRKTMGSKAIQKDELSVIGNKYSDEIRSYKTSGSKKALERVKNPLTKEKAQKAVLKGARVASKLALLSMTDDIFYGGAGKKMVKSAVKHTGRAVVSAWVLANGGSDIRWYDNGILD